MLAQIIFDALPAATLVAVAVVVQRFGLLHSPAGYFGSAYSGDAVQAGWRQSQASAAFLEVGFVAVAVAVWME